jgi:hypothetical protein
METHKGREKVRKRKIITRTLNEETEKERGNKKEKNQRRRRINKESKRERDKNINKTKKLTRK